MTIKADDPRIVTVLDPAYWDGSRVSTRKREIHLYYTKGRGIIMSIRTFLKQGIWETTNLFGDGNMILLLDRGTYRPKLLKAFGATLEANADQIHQLMTDWHDDSKWTRATREAMAWKIAAIIRGDEAQAA